MSAPADVEAQYRDKEIISALYRSLLKRKPEQSGLDGHTRNLRENGLEYVFTAFATSAEFRNRIIAAPPGLELNRSKSSDVQLRLTTDEKAKLWAHVRQVWTGLGETDPYWSVLTDPKFRTEEIGEADAVAEFYATGAHDIEYLDAFLQRSAMDLPERAVVAEFGCGVGRVTGWLARRFSHVLAFDVSASHLKVARERMSAEGVANVEFVQIKGPEGLKQLKDIDLFFSMIVLQHNPPPIMADILEHACRGLKRGGIAFFQAPTYGEDYGFNIKDYLEGEYHKSDMEMHFIPQQEVFRILNAKKMQLIEVRQDHCVGNFDRWISNTFLARKAG